MLGSCFCRLQDGAGSVERAYRDLPSGAAPEIHVWAGDQVYLDAPWSSFLRSYSREELEALFVSNYDLTWGTHHGAGSLGGILTNGGNYFTSDDHEFWNNAPNRAAYVRNSWTGNGRLEWRTLAAELYAVFQTESRLTEACVGNASLLVADVRIDRDDEETRFMTRFDLERLRDWLRALRGPGFLVLGQPVFTEEAGFLGHFLDWTLADYEQYADLVRALMEVEHSVVILTGDVHYGRIARCSLGSGAELIEIISSPLALVDKKAGGKWNGAPTAFPAKPIPGVVQWPVVTESFQAADPHFLTLELVGVGPAVDLTVKYWPIPPGEQQKGRTVFTRRLH
jgi:hypothetical protein